MASWKPDTPDYSDVADASQKAAQLQHDAAMRALDMFASYQARSEELTKPWRDVGMQALDAIQRGFKSGVFARSPWRPAEYRPRSLRGTWTGGFLTEYESQHAPQAEREMPNFRDLPEGKWGLTPGIQDEEQQPQPNPQPAHVAPGNTLPAGTQVA